MATLTESDLKELKDLINSRFDELQAEVSEIKVEVSEIKAEINELKSEVSEIKAEVNELKSEVTEVKAEVTKVKAEVSELKAENAQILEQMKTFEAGQRQIETRLAIIENRMEDWKVAVQKIPDLAEKVGELKNWRQIVFILVTATVGAVIGWVARSGKF